MHTFEAELTTVRGPLEFRLSTLSLDPLEGFNFKCYVESVRIPRQAIFA